MSKFVSDVFNQSLNIDAGIFVVNGSFIANKPRISFEVLTQDKQKPVLYLSD